MTDFLFRGSLAELDPAVKNRISHRGTALRQAATMWAELLGTTG